LPGLVLYYNQKEGRKTPKPERKNKMTYTMEYYEMMNTYLDEVAEWIDFEEDMKTNPYDDPMFAWN
jgi:hypothetical protein